MPLDNSLDSSVSNDLIDNRRLVGNARSTHVYRLPKHTQEFISTHPPAMQTYVVREPSQQTPRNACLPSQQIQVPPPTSTTRLAPNVDAPGSGYLAAIQLRYPPGTSPRPPFCLPREPVDIDFAEGNKEHEEYLRIDHSIKGQVFSIKPDRLRTGIWDAAYYYCYTRDGWIVDLVDGFPDGYLRWCAWDALNDGINRLRVMGFPTAFQRALIAKFSRRPQRILANQAAHILQQQQQARQSHTRHEYVSLTDIAGRPRAQSLPENWRSPTVEIRTACQVIVILDDEEDQSLSRPVKKTFATQSTLPSKRPSDAADVAPAPRRQRRTSKATNVSKGIPDSYHAGRKNTKHDNGTGSNREIHHPMIPHDQQDSRDMTRPSASMPKKQTERGKRLKTELQRPSKGSQSAESSEKRQSVRTTELPGTSSSSMQQSKPEINFLPSSRDAAGLGGLGQSKQAADRSMQPPSKRNRTTKLGPSQSPSQHFPMQRQQQQQGLQEQQQPSHGIHSNVLTNLATGPGQPQSMLKYSRQGPEIPSMEPKLQRIKDIKDLLADHDEDNAEFQSKILNCNGTREAESYRRKLREGKEAQEKLRRELRALEEDVSLYGLLLLLARWGIPLTQFGVAMED